MAYVVLWVVRRAMGSSVIIGPTGDRRSSNDGALPCRHGNDLEVSLRGMASHRGHVVRCHVVRCPVQ